MLQPCSICGRTFNPEVLVGLESRVKIPICLLVLTQARHQGVCKKNIQNSKKRKVFDSSKQRTDFIPVEIKKKSESSPASKPSTKQHVSNILFIHSLYHNMHTDQFRLEEKT